MSREFEALTADQAAEKEVDAFQERAGLLLSPATAVTLFHCMKRVFDWGKLAATTAPVAEPPADAEVAQAEWPTVDDLIELERDVLFKTAAWVRGENSRWFMPDEDLEKAWRDLADARQRSAAAKDSQ